jgi:hypothetical protein
LVFADAEVIGKENTIDILWLEITGAPLISSEELKDIILRKDHIENSLASLILVDILGGQKILGAR